MQLLAGLARRAPCALVGSRADRRMRAARPRRGRRRYAHRAACIGAGAVGPLHDERARLGHARAHLATRPRPSGQRARERGGGPGHRAAVAESGASGRLRAAARAGSAHRDQHQGRFGLGQEHAAAPAEAACGRYRRALERFRADQPGHLAQTTARLWLAGSSLQVCRSAHGRGAADRRSQARCATWRASMRREKCRTCSSTASASTALRRTRTRKGAIC